MGALFKLILRITAAAWPVLRIGFCIAVLIILNRYTRRDASLAAVVAECEARTIRTERAALQYYTLGESSYKRLHRLMKSKRYRRLLKIVKANTNAATVCP